MAGFLTWLGFTAVEVINPFLPWQYPVLALFTGMSFPGGAPPGLHYLNHAAETWFPFLVAFLTAYILTKRRASVRGALALYATFLFWSFCMVVLAGAGISLPAVFWIGLSGTFAGGAILYFRLVDRSSGTGSPK
ncbi:hypothetical protein [Leisingera daeponensis]|uniref:hypothetical protein n=1 Tax=Leisingera daeponensis TaxID=405746 RepID=UPI00047FF74C|nr:hypothetical protein [Leisingera daeponensis]